MQKELTLSLTVRQAIGLRDFIDTMTGKRRVGMVYYQELSDGGLVSRCLSDQTDKDQLIEMIKAQKIFITKSITTAERT